MCVCIYIYLDILQYDNQLLWLPYFHVTRSAIFLPSTPVLFSLDVGLALSISFEIPLFFSKLQFWNSSRICYMAVPRMQRTDTSVACASEKLWNIWVKVTSIKIQQKSWWRHQMEPFSALLALCAGNSPVTGEFPSQRPATRSFDVFFDLHLNKRLRKRSRRRWFVTPWRSLWRRCNGKTRWHE